MKRKQYQFLFDVSTTTQPQIFTIISGSYVEIKTCSQNTENIEKYQLDCEPLDSEIPDAGQYNIYYVDPKGEKISTEIVIVKGKNMKATSFTLQNGEICQTTAFTEIVITFSENPQGTIQSVNISKKTDEAVLITFSKCEFDSTNQNELHCTVPSPSPVPLGEYVLSKINGDDNYDFTDISTNSIKYESYESILGEQIENQS